MRCEECGSRLNPMFVVGDDHPLEVWCDMCHHRACLGERVVVELMDVMWKAGRDWLDEYQPVDDS